MSIIDMFQRQQSVALSQVDNTFKSFNTAKDFGNNDT